MRTITRTMIRTITGATLIIAATVFAAPTALGQSCTGGKLCNGNYKIEDGGYSNPKHKDIMIVVGGVGGANPHFIFAPNKPSEKLQCMDPEILDGGETMSCTQPLDDTTDGQLETVTVGVIGGKFCEALRTIGTFTKVISSADCTHEDCACFMVEHHWEIGSLAAEEYENAVRGERSDGLDVILFGPPSRGTGSGGSP